MKRARGGCSTGVVDLLPLGGSTRRSSTVIWRSAGAIFSPDSRPELLSRCRHCWDSSSDVQRSSPAALTDHAASARRNSSAVPFLLLGVLLGTCLRNRPLRPIVRTFGGRPAKMGACVCDVGRPPPRDLYRPQFRGLRRAV